MISKSPFQFVSSTRGLLLHALVVITLICVSIWDSILIINTFVNENRVTVVWTNMGNDSSQFLEKMHVHTTHHRSLIPQAWMKRENSRNISHDDLEDLALMEMRSGNLSIDSIDVTSIDGQIISLMMFSEIYDMDYFGFECLESTPDLDGCNSIGSNNSRNYGYLMENRSRTEQLETEFHRVLFFNGSIKLNGGPMNGSYIMIHSINNKNLLFAEIQPREIVKTDVRSSLNTFSIALVDDPPSYQWRNNSKTYAYAEILAERGDVATVQIEPSIWYQITVSVKNLGIYDKTKTTACSLDPEVIPSNGNYIKSVYRDYIKTVVKKCACVPFSDKKHVRKFTSIADLSERLPFCDYRMYYECRLRHGPLRIDEDDSLPSCVTIRNEYTVQIYQETCKRKTMCDSVFFGIKATDPTYSVYEDRYQFTTSQFFSQLGGDIGLYTGLSLLSLWQLIAFVHNRYTKYKERHSQIGANGQNGTKSAFLVELFKEIESSLVHFNRRQMEIGKEDENGGDNSRGERRYEMDEKTHREMDVERKMERMVKKAMEKMLKIMEERDRKLEDRLLRMLKHS